MDRQMFEGVNRVKIWPANVYHGQMLARKVKTGNYGKKKGPRLALATGSVGWMTAAKCKMER